MRAIFRAIGIARLAHTGLAPLLCSIALCAWSDAACATACASTLSTPINAASAPQGSTTAPQPSLYKASCGKAICQPGDKLSLALADGKPAEAQRVEARLCIDGKQLGSTSWISLPEKAVLPERTLTAKMFTELIQSALDSHQDFQEALAKMSSEKTVDIELAVDQDAQGKPLRAVAPLTLSVTNLWNSGEFKPALTEFGCGKAEAHQCRLGDTLRVAVAGMSSWMALNKTDASKVHLVINGIPFPALPRGTRTGTQSTAPGFDFQLTRPLVTTADMDPWDTLIHALQRNTSVVTIALATDKGDVFTRTANLNLVLTGENWRYAHFVFALLLILLFFVMIQPGFLRDPPPITDIAPTDMAFSLGRSQMFFWTIMIGVGMLYLWCMTGSFWNINDTALILMGISGATALGASAIGSLPSELQTRVAQYPADKEELRMLRERQQKLEQALTAAGLPHLALTGATPTPEQGALAQVKADIQALETKLNQTKLMLMPKVQSSNLWHDLTRNVDENQTGLHRVQNLLFTLLLGGAFLWLVSDKLAMPYFPASALALLGISGTAYIGYKFAPRS